VVEERSEKLARWVEMQRRMIEVLEHLEARAGEMDRLDLAVYARIVFQHIERTVRAFDEWLQDPLILTSAPRDELERVLRDAAKAAKILARLDADHTERMARIMEESPSREIFAKLSLPRPREEPREGRSSLSM